MPSTGISIHPGLGVLKRRLTIDDSTNTNDKFIVKLRPLDLVLASDSKQFETGNKMSDEDKLWRLHRVVFQVEDPR